MAYIKPKLTETEARALLRFLNMTQARTDLSPHVRRAVAKIEDAARETLNIPYARTGDLYR